MARDSLLHSMLSALPEEERSRFLREVFASLSSVARRELLEHWRSMATELYEPDQQPDQASPGPAGVGGAGGAAARAPALSFEHFSASMGAEFQRERKVQWVRSLACAGILVLATAVVFLLAWALKEITSYFTALAGA